jgi:hypothetical protein
MQFILDILGSSLSTTRKQKSSSQPNKQTNKNFIARHGVQACNLCTQAAEAVDCKFEASLGFLMRPYLKKKKGIK